MIVLFAAFTVLDRTISASGQIADRSEALQRGRQAMALITRQLRSQVCVGTTTPIVSGTDTSISFYADLTDGTPTADQQAHAHLRLDDRHDHRIGRSRRRDLPQPHLHRHRDELAAADEGQADPRDDGTTLRPIFRYYGYQTGTTNGTLVQLSAPLSATDLKRVAVIKVGFRAFALRPISNDEDSSVLEDDVYTRTAVPTELQGAPECI